MTPTREQIAAIVKKSAPPSGWREYRAMRETIQRIVNILAGIELDSATIFAYGIAQDARLALRLLTESKLGLPESDGGSRAPSASSGEGQIQSGAKSEIRVKEEKNG